MTNTGLDPSQDPETKLQMAYIMLKTGTPEQQAEAEIFFKQLLGILPETPREFQEGDTVWINSARSALSNIGKRVILTRFISPNCFKVVNHLGVCQGGEHGAWVVRAEGSSTLIQTWDDGRVVEAKFCLCLACDLGFERGEYRVPVPCDVVPS